MLDDLAEILSALQELGEANSPLDYQDWQDIANEALSGSAPAQYIVATAFEKSGDRKRAADWFRRSARQGYSPAAHKTPPADRSSVA